MKRASYRHAIEWIALNDESGVDTATNPDAEGCERRASEYLSSVIVADLFGVEAERVGRDVMRKRRQLAKGEGDVDHG